MSHVLESAPWGHPWAGWAARMGNPSQAVPQADAMGAFPTPAGSHPPSQASLSLPGCWLLSAGRQSSLQPPGLSASSVDACCHLAGPWAGARAAASGPRVFWGHCTGRARPSLSPPGTEHPLPELPTCKRMHARWCFAEMHPCSWSRGGYTTVPRRGRASSKHLGSTGSGKPTGIWLAKTSGHSGEVTWLPVYNAVGLCQLRHIPL